VRGAYLHYPPLAHPYSARADASSISFYQRYQALTCSAIDDRLTIWLHVDIENHSYFHEGGGKRQNRATGGR
jgi:hypothetical protein